MEAQTGMAMARKPMTNITPLANHCVVSTLRKPSWSYQRISVYSVEKTKKRMARTTTIAIAMASVTLDRRAGFSVVWEVTCASVLLRRYAGSLCGVQLCGVQQS